MSKNFQNQYLVVKIKKSNFDTYIEKLKKPWIKDTDFEGSALFFYGIKVKENSKFIRIGWLLLTNTDFSLDTELISIPYTLQQAINQSIDFKKVEKYLQPDDTYYVNDVKSIIPEIFI